jgi:hypothetical protein
MTPPKIRCRQIAEADLDAVARLLARGFPERDLAYWRTGLARMAEREVPSGYPRFGYMLDHEGVAVGAILLIFTALPGSQAVRCNLSSWYVDPAYRGHASPMIFVSLKHRSVTYVNISPAKHTWPTIEAQGFCCYARGQLVSMPLLARPAPGVSLRLVAADGPGIARLPPEEARLLERHARYGCLSLVADTPRGPLPFVFAKATPVHAGPLALSCLQLAYARDSADFISLAGNLGRLLARRRVFFVALDADGPIPGLRGSFRPSRGRRYFRGPDRPRLNELADTELVLFGA